MTTLFDLGKIPSTSLLNNSSLFQLLLDEYLINLKAQSKYSDPKKLAPFGYKIYSQGEEDGIINEIFTRIGTKSKRFIEFGVGNGLENNTLALLLNGWNGLWIESSKSNVKRIVKGFKKSIEHDFLTVINEYVTKENINEIITSEKINLEVDLLSVDIDGNDFHIVSSINCVKPRVIVIEYNSKFPPPIQYCMDYNPRHKWSGSDNFGASLKFLELKLSDLNYALVGCSLTGCNAFFIRKDLTADYFSEPFSAEHHYEPPRYFLTKQSAGHAANYVSVDNIILSMGE